MKMKLCGKEKEAEVEGLAKVHEMNDKKVQEDWEWEIVKFFFYETEDGKIRKKSWKNWGKKVEEWSWKKLNGNWNWQDSETNCVRKWVKGRKWERKVVWKLDGAILILRNVKLGWLIAIFQNKLNK